MLAQAPSLSALELQHATGKSQASISLALTRLGGAVFKLGAARSTRYARTHPILGLDARQIISLAGPHPEQGLFGQSIGNTDMHFGNLSFFVDDVTQPVFVPTPVYDMLPMAWRPGVHGGELDLTPIHPQPQPAGFEAQAQQARAWAIDFWERSALLPGLGDTLREASAANARNLRRD